MHRDEVVTLVDGSSVASVSEQVKAVKITEKPKPAAKPAPEVKPAAKVEAAAPSAQTEEAAPAAVSADGCYSYADLKSPGPFPDGIDVTKREEYLSPSEFDAVFKMSKAEFAALPKWKRDGLKRKLDLF